MSKKSIMNKSTIIWILSIFSIFLFIILVRKNSGRIEKFSSDNYLYPIANTKCGNLKASYMPKSCYVDGKLDPYSNCKCEDEFGNCKICYPKIDHSNTKEDSNAEAIYDASENFSPY